MRSLCRMVWTVQQENLRQQQFRTDQCCKVQAFSGKQNSPLSQKDYDSDAMRFNNALACPHALFRRKKMESMRHGLWEWRRYSSGGGGATFATRAPSNWPVRTPAHTSTPPGQALQPRGLLCKFLIVTAAAAAAAIVIVIVFIAVLIVIVIVITIFLPISIIIIITISNRYLCIAYQEDQ